MEVKLYYTEITDYIKKNYGQTVSVKQKTPKTLALSYIVNAFLFSKEMTLELTVESVRSTSLTVAYGGSTGVGTLVKGALAVLKSKMPEISAALTHNEGRSLTIELSRIAKLKPVLDYFELADLQIAPDALLVTLRIK